MPLKDSQVLYWVKDPNVLFDEIKSMSERNTALRQQIIDKIKEYQQDPLRLYTFNYKDGTIIGYNYRFTKEECVKWVKDYLVNPRTGNHLTNDEYIELIYSAIQYGISLKPLKPILHKIDGKYLGMIEDIETRFDNMKECDAYFMALPQDAKKKKKVKNKVAKYSFGVSTSSSPKSLNASEKKELKDLILQEAKAAKATTNALIRNYDYVFEKNYTTLECLRWVRQPNKDPKTGTLILRDGKEYNMIFEQALLFDSNIQPMNITSEGIEFKKSVLIMKALYFGVESKSPDSSDSSEIEEEDDVCKVFLNIHEEDESYKAFKKEMKGVCLKYQKKDVVCMDKIKSLLVERFTTEVPTDDELKVRFNYFENSALASIMLYYDSIAMKKYSKIFQTLFTNNFRKFKVYNTYEIDDELIFHRKVTVDGGGPIREFFTKLFEELFCDEEHPTRPFICPKDNIENRYYINPNFALDEGFRKVLAAKKIDSASINYNDIFTMIGKILCITFVNQELKLPKQLSTYIIAGLIKRPRSITNYDLLYFYVKEFKDAPMYLNMINEKQIEWIDERNTEFNDLYVISKKEQQVKKGNFIKFLLQLAKHIVSKNFLRKDDAMSSESMKKRYVSLFTGFNDGFNNKIRPFIAKNKVSVEQVNSMITYKKMDDAILQEFARKINIEMEGINRLKKREKDKKVQEMRRYITNIITNKGSRNSDEDHYVFIRRLLRFWTGLPNYEKDTNYTIFYKYGRNEFNNQPYDVTNLPVAATCFNHLDIFGFPLNKSSSEREQYLYEKIKLAVELTAGMELK